MPSNPGRTMADATPPELLFHERGASWYWLIAGPIAGAVMLWIEISAGLGPQLVVPAMFMVLVSGFLALQVKAARIHTSVELTSETLRQGAETIAIDAITRIYPEPEPDGEPERWQSARALGELTGVPRRRKGIGLKLTEGRMAQAWARDHRQLRAVLTAVFEQRRSEKSPPGAGS
jgi:hypothetical protein